MKDLIVLVADLDAEETMKALLSRYQSLQIQQITFDILRHPERDPGCCGKGHELLRSQRELYRKAVILFDHHGSGRDNDDAEEIQNEIEINLEKTGWDRENVCAIVLQPELEIWVWSDSRQLDECLGWNNHNPHLRLWLQENGFWETDMIKPHDPKEAMIQALREVKKRHTAVVFKNIAQSVSLRRCGDPGFDRLRTILKKWFSTEG